MPMTPRSIKHPMLLLKSRKLDGNIQFNGLDIAIETGRSRMRQWYNPQDDTHGISRMCLPYGYIRGTMGVDGDAVDVFVGPDRTAQEVYVIHTRKAPDFREYDEDKCIVGVSSPEEAQRVFLASYSDPRFYGGMSTWSFEEFKTAVMTTKKHPRKLEKAQPLAKSGEAICKMIGDDLGVDWNETDLDEFCNGMFEEQAHADEVGGDQKKLAGIVLDHLLENPKYYSKLAKLEKAIQNGKEVLQGWNGKILK